MAVKVGCYISIESYKDVVTIFRDAQSDIEVSARFFSGCLAKSRIMERVDEITAVS